LKTKINLPGIPLRHRKAGKQIKHLQPFLFGEFPEILDQNRLYIAEGDETVLERMDFNVNPMTTVVR
jgi:hypothetical protein